MQNKGQAMVEFAIMLPFLLAISFAIIYGGAMFMDYTQYSNAARDAARDISLQTGSTSDATTLRNNLATNIKAQDKDTLERYAVPFTNLYKPTWNVKFYNASGNVQDTASNALDVEVTIELDLVHESGGLIADWGVLPKQLKPINFKMTLER